MSSTGSSHLPFSKMATMGKDVQVLAFSRSNSSSAGHDDKDKHILDLDFATQNNTNTTNTNKNKNNLEEEIVFEEEEEDIEQAKKETPPPTTCTTSSLTFAVVDAASRYTDRTVPCSCLCFLGYGTCCAVVNVLGCITFIGLLVFFILYLAGTEWVENLD
jgi:hypothetical protein